MNATQIPQRVIDRALSNIDIDPERGCWISRYSVGSHGYAQIGWNEPGERTQMKLVHRVAYVAVRGPIPADMTVDHMCKQRRCCNPDHLRLLSNYENGRRTDGRDWPVGQCANGHPNSMLEEFSGRMHCGVCYREWQLAWAKRNRKECVDCGATIGPRSTRCHPCASVESASRKASA